MKTFTLYKPIRTGILLMVPAMLVMLALAVFQSCRDQLPDITDDAIYVANEEEGSITVIDAGNREIIKTIDLMDKTVWGKYIMLMPHNVQVAPDGKSVWVTGVPMNEEEEEQVIVIDPLKNKIKDRIKLGKDLHLAHVVLDDASQFAYVTANEACEVIKIDAAKCKEVARYNLGDGKKPHGLRYGNGKLYIANMGGMSLSVIDVSNGNITEVPLDGVAVQTAVAPDGQNVYVSLYDTREIVRVNTSSLSVTRLSLPQGAEGPIQLYPSPDNSRLFVCDQGGLLGRPVNNLVYVVDLASFSVADSVLAGNKTHGVVVDHTGNKAYVTNTQDNTVSVIDIASMDIIATISVGTGPNGIACWHKEGNGYGGQP